MPEHNPWDATVNTAHVMPLNTHILQLENVNHLSLDHSFKSFTLFVSK